MKVIAAVCVVLVFICSNMSAENIVPKKAGVAFRFDDNHSVKVWKPMLDVFDKHGLKAGLSINPGWLRDNGLPQLFKAAQENGHEVMNHTPYHRYYALPLPDAKLAQKYVGKPGVDHVNGKKVCFKYVVMDKVAGKKSPLAKAVVAENGKIKFENSKYVRGYYSSPFHIEPDGKRFFTLGRKTDKDGYYQLHNLWREPVTDVTPNKDAICVFDSNRVKLTPEAFKIEGEVAHAQFAKWGIKRPITWIHPGCGEPTVHVENIKKSYGDVYNYTSAAVYLNKADKVFNEYDPDDTRRFAMQWSDFRSEGHTLEKMKEIIADSVACHRVAFDASHLRGSPARGGQEGYLKRMDELLAWLKENNIPVRTQAEWAKILYQSTPDPKAKVFPSFNTDLDKNNRPDGVFPGKNIEVITLDNGQKALKATARGKVCDIKKLGGLEKGINKCIVNFKAPKDAKISLNFMFNKGGKKLLWFKGNGQWQKASQELDIPQNASWVNINISTYASEPVIIQSVDLVK